MKTIIYNKKSYVFVDFSVKFFLVGLISILLYGCQSLPSKKSNANYANNSESHQFLESYAKIAYQNYKDSLRDAIKMRQALVEFSRNSTKFNFDKAKQAWLDARESYGQSEAFRLQDGPIDAEAGWVSDVYGNLEGQINAWPLDENMIDYTVNSQGKRTSGNIIDTLGVYTPSGEATAVNVKKLSPDTLIALNENGSDANVTTGYHAIEFLLWGQDQDYKNFIKDSITNGALQAGNRPLTDFTTDKFSYRRKQYLLVVSKKLVNDLKTLVSAWSPDSDSNYQAAFLRRNSDESKNIDTQQAIKQVFAGMGVYIKSELANERLAVALLTPSEEDEHSCFSDNTHRDIINNYQGFKNILSGTYNNKNIGFSILNNFDLTETGRLMQQIEGRLEAMDTIAKTSRHFDYQIHPDDPQAKELNRLKNDLRRLGDRMLVIASKFDIELNVDDVTDPDETSVN